MSSPEPPVRASLPAPPVKLADENEVAFAAVTAKSAAVVAVAAKALAAVAASCASATVVTVIPAIERAAADSVASAVATEDAVVAVARTA